MSGFMRVKLVTLTYLKKIVTCPTVRSAVLICIMCVGLHRIEVTILRHCFSPGSNNVYYMPC